MSSAAPGAVHSRPIEDDGNADAAAERELAEQLFAALARVLRWSAQQSSEQFGPGVISALATVVDYGPVRLGDLAAREGISPAALSRTVALLEARGLCTRLTDPADRRSAFVEASDAGRRVVRERRRERGAQLAAHLGALDDGERAAVQRIIAALDALVRSEYLAGS